MVKISCGDECQILTENIEDTVKDLSKNVREYVDESTVDLNIGRDKRMLQNAQSDRSGASGIQKNI